MPEISFQSLLDEFLTVQKEDIAFFKQLEQERALEDFLTFVYQRLYLRRKFLAQFRNVSPEGLSPEEAKNLLARISKALEGEAWLAKRLKELRASLKTREKALRQKVRVVQAYQRRV